MVRQAPKRVVVKLGTSVLTGGTTRLDRAHMVELVRQMARLHQAGVEIVLVTSGAIAAGREHLGFPELSDSLASKQMLAAVGQSQLIQAWEQLFNLYGLHVGQILLTRADLDDRERYLNARDTLQALLDNRIIPVINENDAVAIAEIKVGDNDNLSALAALLAQADLLLLLTDQEGLYDADPRKHPDAKLIPEVARIDDALRALAGDSGTSLGTGGMATKLQAADVAVRAGVEVVVAAGRRDGVIERLCRGEAVGTRFLPQHSALDSRKRWILAGPPPNGSLQLDAGAVRALCQQGSSLLAKGILKVEGQFLRGATLVLTDPDGKPVARGIARYGASEIEQMRGIHSSDIETTLGFSHGPAVIHRNDLVVL
ncbi:glutamate 5-kinase [Ferrimonas marina]|uniref:Glutamate 5-kinase n=1 Tax=Ferrimonas marina TaxID=299255 RepID=A0A1M5YGM0_9GAMM|nr:glutamate 5-kinase [Ferrimonas marina]SHI11126.1 glutamate 5-kinase [Ferrimonas marina]